MSISDFVTHNVSQHCASYSIAVNPPGERNARAVSMKVGSNTLRRTGAPGCSWDSTDGGIMRCLCRTNLLVSSNKHYKYYLCLLKGEQTI